MTEKDHSFRMMEELSQYKEMSIVEFIAFCQQTFGKENTTAFLTWMRKKEADKRRQHEV